MNEIKLDERLDRIERHLISTKTVLSFDEAVSYTGYSRSYLYKLTSNNIIPFSKPNGKTIFFSKKRLDEWLLSNGNKTESELEKEAISYNLKR